ncbi:GNAT family N-acetyltransferase [Sphingobacterium mizutaii]|uniref:GNAT family N-acetyltransferase n=1 Tax=Sphingobacterium mizutaii TaxID=1010 RepID=UPI001625265A|nr:GNAT family N-acetyltransferase [Sphingobacterium mizutaii]
MTKVIEKLIWDSDFFDKKIGKINLDLQNLNFSMLDYDLVYVFSDQSNLPFNLVDKKIVYLIEDLSSINIGSNFPNISFFDKESDNYNELLSLTYQSGEYSRFNLDKNFSNLEFRNLYRKWIDNSISKQIATHILVKKIEGKIVGFATLGAKNSELADIGLVAVDASYRGKGIAKELVNSAIKLSKELGYKKIQVVTQLDNHPANLLYTKSGFKQHTITYIYHIWKHDTI